MEQETTTMTNEQNSAQNTESNQQVNNTTVADKVSQIAADESKNDSKSIDIEKLIQKAVDRATNKLGNDNKKLREQVDALRKQNLSEAELKELEIRDKEADIADREAKLRDKENRLIAIRAIKDVGLDDGSSNALELVDFVMCDSEEATKAKVKTLDILIKKLVAAEVNRTFKQNGRNPEKGGSGHTDVTHHVIRTLGEMTADRRAVSKEVLDFYIKGDK